MEDGHQPQGFIPSPGQPPADQIVPQEAQVPTSSTIDTMSYRELQEECRHLVALIGDQSREIIRYRNQVESLEARLRSVSLDSQMKVQEMLGKRFSEMRPQDIPVFDPRFRAMMLFSEYQSYRKASRGDITATADRDHKRMRDILSDIRKENELDILNRHGVNINRKYSEKKLGINSLSGQKGKGRSANISGERVGTTPDEVELSPEFAASLGLSKSSLGTEVT